MVKSFLSRHRSLGVVAFLGLLVVLTALCVCVGIPDSMRPIPYPTPAFPIENLLLDKSVFPEGWRPHHPFDPEVRLPAEQIVLYFHRSRCPSYWLVAGHEVYRFYAGATSAAEAYPEEIAVWFSPTYGTWSVPAELPYHSVVADQFQFACYTEERTGNMTCQEVAQYEEYIVVFDVEMNPEYQDCLSFSDLERILVAIDDRMAFYLGKEME